MQGLGRIFIVLGVLFIVVGLAFIFGDKIPYVGRLPGDIFVKKERFCFYFPITTSILISIILTILFSIFKK